MKRVLIFLAWLFAMPAAAQTVDVAVILDDASPHEQQVLEQLQNETAALTGGDLVIRFPESLRVAGGGSLPQIRQGIDEALANPRVDVVVALGVLGSAALGNRQPAKPVIAAAVIDPVSQGFPGNEDGTSATRNVHYLNARLDVVTELRRFQSVVGAQRVVALADRAIIEALPVVEDVLAEVARSVGFGLELVAADGEAPAPAVERLDPDVDAVFVLPMLRVDAAGREALAAALIERRLPSFATVGQPDVESGLLMGTRLVLSPQQLARRLAVDLRDIAVGRSADSLQVTVNVENRLFLNMDTARALAFSPSFQLLFEAELIRDFEVPGRRLDLRTAVEESLQRNLSLAIADRDVQVAAEDRELARASLLPQVGFSTGYSALDSDLALFGPDRFGDAQASVSQNLFSEPLWGSLASAGFLAQAEEATRRGVALDVIRDTAVAYLDVLVARTEREIQIDNLRLTVANLERARFRYRVGSANRGEVDRFETQLGNDRQQVTNAQSNFQSAQFELNRLMQRPATDLIAPAEPSLAEAPLFGNERLESFFDNPVGMDRLGRFMALEAIENSPELEALAFSIDAQRRELKVSNRRRFLPSVDLTGAIERTFADSGAPTGLEFDNDWSLGLTFTWSLFEGNRIAAEQRQNRALLERLELQAQQQSDILVASANRNVVRASASRLNIAFARDAEAAAASTLSLVTDSYVRGASDYIDLIDAQSSFLSARLAAANATYNHLTDLVELQRSIGFFDFNVDPTEAALWFQRLDEFVENDARQIP